MGDAVKGDRVEIVIDAGGTSRTYEVAATRAGRRVEVVTGRGVVEVMEVTRGGGQGGPGQGNGGPGRGGPGDRRWGG